ncbi:MAG TPA: DUF4097 family beta strand repeat-containing protein [Candidatus Methylomirabilis sp.]|nr:DUF4097 family beta strand repeat-containing protein [Candidatus Methylomirabilis sp.]
MLRPVLRSAVLCILTLGLVSAAPCLAVSKDFKQIYPLQPGGSFELQNVNGPVEVQGWDRNEVEIHAVKTAKENQADLDRVSIEVEATPAEVSVVTRYPQDEGVEVAVEYTVHVPHTALVEHVGTVNGTLKIAGVDSVADLHTVNGNIEVYEGAGSVHARTTNGNVHLELLHFQDDKGMTAETTNGSVLLAVPADTQANLEARSMNGSFYSELPLSVESSQRPRETLGRYGKGGAPIKLNTVNGGIRVVILRSTV